MNKTIKVKEFKDIIDYFNDIHCTDVSNVDITIGDIEENKLGSCNLYTNEIVISNKISGSLLECVIVHELSHYLQQQNISMCIDITSTYGYSMYYNTAYTIADLVWDEQCDDNYYWDRLIEIDARLNELCFAYYITEDIKIIDIMKETAFKGGLTNNLYSCISNIAIDCVRDFLLSEYTLRNKYKEEQYKKANDEFLLALDGFEL